MIFDPTATLWLVYRNLSVHRTINNGFHRNAALVVVVEQVLPWPITLTRILVEIVEHCRAPRGYFFTRNASA
jgi:hypothetical protein